MARYAVGGRTAAGTQNEPLGALWNPHASIDLHVLFWSIDVAIAAATRFFLARITTRGTPGSTVTPDADNALDRRASPASGALLDLADYTVNPTIETPPLERFEISAPLGSAIWKSYDPLRPLLVPAGTGLCLMENNEGTPGTLDMTFMWRE